VEKAIAAKPLRSTFSSNVRWKVEPVEGKLRIGEVVRIEGIIPPREESEQEKRISFGKCQLNEIHNFWGKYAIVSMVSILEEEIEGVNTYHLFWIETNFLQLPDRQVRAAYQAKLLHPFIILQTL
jgi:hypothetical protein